MKKKLLVFHLFFWCFFNTFSMIYANDKVEVNTGIACPSPFFVGTNLGPTECGWIGIVPSATITEDPNCTNYSVVTNIYDNENNLIETLNGNGGGPVVLSTEGCSTGYTIEYVVTDNCPDVNFCSTSITILDDDPPNVICKEALQTTLNSDGISIVPASVFDEGSYDQCCLQEDITVEIRKMGTSQWVPFVILDCDDAGADPVLVEFRAADCCGNVSETCMTEVYVDEKTPPVITCPPNMEVTCNSFSDPYDGEQIKLFLEDNNIEANAIDNCQLDRIECQVIQIALDENDSGMIRVRYLAYDQGYPNVNFSSCIMTITVPDNPGLIFNCDQLMDVCITDPNACGGTVIIPELPATECGATSGCAQNLTYSVSGDLNSMNSTNVPLVCTTYLSVLQMNVVYKVVVLLLSKYWIVLPRPLIVQRLLLLY